MPEYKEYELQCQIAEYLCRRYPNVLFASDVKGSIKLTMPQVAIEVAQFNREGSKGIAPGIHDLEGSGQLEKDASIVALLEIESPSETGFIPEHREASLRVVKGRNTATGIVTGTFHGRTLTFDFST